MSTLFCPLVGQFVHVLHSYKLAPTNVNPDLSDQRLQVLSDFRAHVSRADTSEHCLLAIKYKIKLIFISCLRKMNSFCVVSLFFVKVTFAGY